MGSMTSNVEAPVLVSREGHLTRIVLNRPRAINALTLEMIETIRTTVEAAQHDGSRAILIEGAGERGLCGGADIKALAGGGAEYAVSVVEAEYEVDLLINESTVPVIGFMDGITMGGGIGLTGHATIRVVTERSRLAMPEVKIGIVPDVGGHRLLASAPGNLGDYLAVTAESFGAADAIAIGFADHFVPSERLAELRDELVAGLEDGHDPWTIVERAATTAPRSTLFGEREWIDPIFEDVLVNDRPVSVFMATTEGHVELAQWAVAAAKHLVGRLELTDHAGARETARTMRNACPMSVAVTLAQLARTRTLDLSLEEVLADDLRVLSRLLRRPDFAEGVRAVVIDKDGNAAWQPAAIEDLDPREVADVLAP